MKNKNIEFSSDYTENISQDERYSKKNFNIQKNQKKRINDKNYISSNEDEYIINKAQKKKFIKENEKLKEIQRQTEILKKEHEKLLKLKELTLKKKQEEKNSRLKRDNVINQKLQNQNNIHQEFTSNIILRDISTKDNDVLIFKDRDLDTQIPLSLFSEKDMEILDAFRKFIVRKINKKYNQKYLKNDKNDNSYSNDITLNKKRKRDLKSESESLISSFEENNQLIIKKEKTNEIPDKELNINNFQIIQTKNIDDYNNLNSNGITDISLFQNEVNSSLYKSKLKYNKNKVRNNNEELNKSNIIIYNNSKTNKSIILPPLPSKNNEENTQKLKNNNNEIIYRYYNEERIINLNKNILENNYFNMNNHKNNIEDNNNLLIDENNNSNRNNNIENNEINNNSKNNKSKQDDENMISINE